MPLIFTLYLLYIHMYIHTYIHTCIQSKGRASRRCSEETRRQEKARFGFLEEAKREDFSTPKGQTGVHFLILTVLRQHDLIFLFVYLYFLFPSLKDVDGQLRELSAQFDAYRAEKNGECVMSMCMYVCMYVMHYY